MAELQQRSSYSGNPYRVKAFSTGPQLIHSCLRTELRTSCVRAASEVERSKLCASCIHARRVGVQTYVAYVRASLSVADGLLLRPRSARSPTQCNSVYLYLCNEEDPSETAATPPRTLLHETRRNARQSKASKAEGLGTGWLTGRGRVSVMCLCVQTPNTPVHSGGNTQQTRYPSRRSVSCRPLFERTPATRLKQPATATRGGGEADQRRAAYHVSRLVSRRPNSASCPRAVPNRRAAAH